MTGFQDYNPNAQAQEGDALYDVSITIPQIGAATPEEAAETFWRILSGSGLHLVVDVIESEHPRLSPRLRFHVTINGITGEAE